MPVREPPPPRDELLGTEDRPAVSCVDIQKWGPKDAKSGSYWIDIKSKGAVKVACDMETEGGGWTLFFNYIHQPGQQFSLSPNKLPADFKASNHMYLEEAGFDEGSVKQLRFQCEERPLDKSGVPEEKIQHWHFKTNNQQLIQVALTGSQYGLNIASIQAGYIELDKIEEFQGENDAEVPVSKEDISSFDIYGSSPTGGFSTTPFGSSSGGHNNNGRYWTVIGDISNKPVFECGASHRGEDESPEMVFSHHAVFFKGSAPNNEEARARFDANALKGLGKKKKEE